MNETGILIANIILIILTFIVPIIYFLWPLFFNKNKNIKEFLINQKYRLVFSLLLMLTLGTRLIFIDRFPGGFNQDEASAAYDAYAIMTTGKDRAGNFLPIHLVAWGSGQNALYSYLMIPFIAIFGLNEFACRLPMALTGVLCVICFYKLIKLFANDKVSLIALAFFVINPWHIMKSRWALESNLFPDLVLISVFLLIYGLIKNKTLVIYCSLALFGLSAYAYGTSYFFLFFFVIFFISYLLIKKKLKLYQGTICLGIIGLIVIPIMLFIYINTQDKDSLTYLGFTIPKLTENRFQSVTNLFSNDFFKSCKDNFTNGINLILKQYDGLPWNSIEVYGAYYIFSFPFVLIGLFKKSEENWINNIMKLWLLVSFMMMLIVSPNINRINIVFIPLIYFAGLGLGDIMSTNKLNRNVLASLYVVSFLCFSNRYLNDNQKRVKDSFFYSFNDALRFANNLDVDNIYVTSTVNMPYIFALFTSEYNVNEYLETRVIANPGSAFESISSFGKYHFYLPNSVNESSCYIVRNGEKNWSEEYLSAFEVEYFDSYYVVYNL